MNVMGSSVARRLRRGSSTAALSLVLAAAAGAETHALIVAGLGGEADYETAFTTQAEAAADHARAAGSAVALLTGQAATRAGIAAAIADIAATANAEDVVIVHLIGHGSWDEEHYRFNVPGPDPTAGDMARWLDSVAAERQLAIVATSAGGAALAPLRRDGRALVAATRDGREKNAVVFGGIWTEALADPRADADKNGRISAAEAFRFAEEGVAEYYASRQRIATEHPLLDGDGTGFAVALAVAAGEAPAVTEVADADPEVAYLVRRVDELTGAIDALKARKRGLAEDDYFTRLQVLLMELAGVERQLREQRDESPMASPSRP